MVGVWPRDCASPSPGGPPADALRPEMDNPFRLFDLDEWCEYTRAGGPALFKSSANEMLLLTIPAERGEAGPDPFIDDFLLLLVGRRLSMLPPFFESELVEREVVSDCKSL